MKDRETNRESMPNVAEIIDTFRETFGEVKVTACEDKETGVKAGEFKGEKHEKQFKFKQ